MATTLVSIEEYLRNSYEPDAKYVDGVIEQRDDAMRCHDLFRGDSCRARLSGQTAYGEHTKADDAVKEGTAWRHKR